MKSFESLLRLWLWVRRQEVRFARISVKWFAHRNLTSRKPIVAPGGPIISLTTFDKRLFTVYLTIESIAAGSVLPSRIILWVDNPDAFENRPHSLRRLEARGLEIKLTPNYGPHKKYYPFLESTDRFDVPFVTADDDVIYPKSWLNGLVQNFNGNPSVINCYRAHTITIAAGTIAPYDSWVRCRSSKPSFLNFAVGNSGCIYPPAFLRALKAAGKGFEDRCPMADDVWLHVNAIRAYIMVRQIYERPLDFPTLPETQDVGLCVSNITLGGNDVQIKKTYDRTDIDALVSCLSS
jgi:hypothetical protein